MNKTPATKGSLKTRDSMRWWIKLFLQPLLLLIFLVATFFVLGVLQQMGLLTDANAPLVGDLDNKTEDSTSYICPMMCTPPSLKPGRCPVCAMELVAAASGNNQADARSIVIDSVARRVAGIETVTVEKIMAHHAIESIGELEYDQGGRKTLAAYVDGRIEQLYADYTGVKVSEKDTLAVLYSPKLYSAQVELLLALRARENSQGGTLARVAEINENLERSVRQRLIELGMTKNQIDAVERTGRADSRLPLLAPTNGTVVKKAVVEGQYVSEGDTIYELADLSNVWLMLQLFPEDAALVRYGVKVRTELQSLPGQYFDGRVAFIDPLVDPRTRTVGVRVVIPNPDGILRIGDYATATIEVPLGSADAMYDPELVGQWISPRHPHIMSDGPGNCSICAMPLVPATTFGFTDDPSLKKGVLVVPRDAVLSAGNKSVVYVESEPGHFEIRNVVLGPVVEDGIVIADGLQAGEEVARKGNFLIDSQMQLVGNPSLIDPTIATSVTDVSRTTVKPIDLGDLPPIGPMSVPPSDGSAPDDSGSPTQTMRLAEPSFSSGEENGPSIPPVGEMKLADPPAMSVPGVAP